MQNTTHLDAATINSYLRDKDTFAKHLDIEIIEVSHEHSIALMPLSTQHRNGMGNAHGGAIFSLADMAFAALAQTSGVFFVNAQSSISYLSPGRIGPLRGEAKTIRKGKTMTVCEVRILDSDESLVAIALITGYNTSISMDKIIK